MTVVHLNLLWKDKLSMSLTWLLEEDAVVIVTVPANIYILVHRHVDLLLHGKKLLWMDLNCKPKPFLSKEITLSYQSGTIVSTRYI